jgi:uncharacterized protein involved in propanediol utilization
MSNLNKNKQAGITSSYSGSINGIVFQKNGRIRKKKYKKIVTKKRKE